MTEIRPAVWRLRAYVSRCAHGTPIQTTKTIHAKVPRSGAGKRRAERELATMVADVSKGNVATGTETVGELLDA
jgi:hypothetical protein